MRKDKSEQKGKSVDVVGDMVLFIGTVANAASRLDRRAVSLMAAGVAAMKECAKAETDMNADRLAHVARALSAFAMRHSATPLPIIRAADNMADAFREYAANNYGRANIKAQSAKDNMR